MLTLVVMPILVLTAVLAEKIVLFLFGAEWTGMTNFVTILAIGAVVGSYNSFNDSVMVSQGRTDLLLRINAIEKVILIIGVVIGVGYGILGVAYAKVISVAIMFIPKLLVLSRVSNISVATWVAAHGRLFIGLILSGGVSLLLRDVVKETIASLALSVSTALLINWVWLFVTREPTLNEARDFVKNIYQRIA